MADTRRSLEALHCRIVAAIARGAVEPGKGTNLLRLLGEGSGVMQIRKNLKGSLRVRAPAAYCNIVHVDITADMMFSGRIRIGIGKV